LNVDFPERSIVSPTLGITMSQSHLINQLGAGLFWGKAARLTTKFQSRIPRLTPAKPIVIATLRRKDFQAVDDAAGTGKVNSG
jgi:hypothetical protein